jgi:ketosteroid isomerase-like protein
MSHENMELVRSIYAAWQLGDFSAAGWADPKIDYVMADGPNPGTWTGLAAMAEGARTRLNAWEDFRFEADEYRELDSERLLVLDRVSGRGRASALELGHIYTRGATLFHIRAGKVTRLVQYWDADRALAEVGHLRERARSPEDG